MKEKLSEKVRELLERQCAKSKVIARLQEEYSVYEITQEYQRLIRLMRQQGTAAAAITTPHQAHWTGGSITNGVFDLCRIWRYEKSGESLGKIKCTEGTNFFDCTIFKRGTLDIFKLSTHGTLSEAKTWVEQNLQK